MLSSLLRQLPKFPAAEPEPEDIFQYSLGLIFTDDLQIQHGDPGNIVKYRSNGYGDLEFEVADPQGEEERTKFAHYLWNSGVLMSEFVGGRGKERNEKRDSHQASNEDEEWGKRKFLEGEEWWLSEEEERKWSVKGETVLELGAGVCHAVG
jgi:nicotinamide N-methyltransferase